jgi:hypothetical protein
MEAGYHIKKIKDYQDLVLGFQKLMQKMMTRKIISQIKSVRKPGPREPKEPKPARQPKPKRHQEHYDQIVKEREIATDESSLFWILLYQNLQ